MGLYEELMKRASGSNEEKGCQQEGVPHITSHTTDSTGKTAVVWIDGVKFVPESEKEPVGSLNRLDYQRACDIFDEGYASYPQAKGCPFPADTAAAVCWVHGRRTAKDNSVINELAAKCSERDKPHCVGTLSIDTTAATEALQALRQLAEETAAACERAFAPSPALSELTPEQQAYYIGYDAGVHSTEAEKIGICLVPEVANKE